MFAIRTLSSSLLYRLLLCGILSFSLHATANSTHSTFKHLQNKEWNDAIKTAKKSCDPLLLKIALSYKFLNAPTNFYSFEEVIDFINANPKWPNQTQLKQSAERAITNSTKTSAMLAWFKNNPTLTDHGAKSYAIYAGNLIKDPNIQKNIISEGWIYGDFSKEEQTEFLSKNKALLTKQDHIKKVDYLLWHDKPAKALEVMPLLDKKNIQLFKAAIAIKQNKQNNDELFNNLDEEKKHHSVLLYSYLKSHEKDDVIPDHLAELIIHAPNDHDHSTEWWKLKARFLRDQIKYKKYKTAYLIAKNHHATKNEDIGDAEFLAGWLALRYLKQPETALHHFKNMKKVFKQPISVARTNYWIGRTYLALGNKEEAHKFFRDAGTYYYTFYGQLALIELGQNAITLPKRPQITDKHKYNLSKNELARAAKMLIDNNMDDTAIPYIKEFLNRTHDPAEALLAIDYIRNKKITHTISLAKAASYNKILLLDDAFPTKYKITNKFIEPAFAYSIIRQETMFDQHAISTKNAHGLMQVLPETACKTAKTLNMKCKPSKHLLTDVAYNTTLGTKTLKNELDKFNGSYILAIIAYNAGPHRADEWIEIYGDPRELKNRYAIIDWIETIPFHETRNYVQRVLENLQIYRTILCKKSSLKLLQDIGLKGK